MAVRKRGGKKRSGRKRRGGMTNKILSGIKSYKKVASALGVRKGLASLGKLGINTGLRVAAGRAAMLR
jgi:hypothetical protein